LQVRADFLCSLLHPGQAQPASFQNLRQISPNAIITDFQAGDSLLKLHMNPNMLGTGMFEDIVESFAS